jgi:hypothetical protein
MAPETLDAEIVQLFQKETMTIDDGPNDMALMFSHWGPPVQTLNGPVGEGSIDYTLERQRVRFEGYFLNQGGFKARGRREICAIVDAAERLEVAGLPSGYYWLLKGRVWDHEMFLLARGSGAPKIDRANGLRFCAIYSVQSREGKMIFFPRELEKDAVSYAAAEFSNIFCLMCGKLKESHTHKLR